MNTYFNRNNKKYDKIRFKKVMVYDNQAKIFRLCRIMWKRGKGAGHGSPKNFHVSFKVAISKKPFHFQFDKYGFVITLFCLRFTYEKHFGGIPV